MFVCMCFIISHLDYLSLKNASLFMTRVRFVVLCLTMAISLASFLRYESDLLTKSLPVNTFPRQHYTYSKRY